jgi:hypothetical protein
MGERVNPEGVNPWGAFAWGVKQRRARIFFIAFKSMRMYFLCMEMETVSPQQFFVDYMADGFSFEEIKRKLTVAPFNLSEDQVNNFYRDAELLQRIIETANARLGQTWGSMWRQIKIKAALGSIQESKILIDFIQNGKAVPFSKLRVIFDDTTTV